jgi:hypothetical protein
MTTVLREPEQERLYTFKLSSMANQQGKFRGQDLQLFQAIQKKTESAPGNRHLPQGGAFRHSAKCGVNRPGDEQLPPTVSGICLCVLLLT